MVENDQSPIYVKNEYFPRVGSMSLSDDALGGPQEIKTGT